MELLSQLGHECSMPYKRPKYRFIEINKCMIDNCPINANDNTFWSYMDYLMCQYPGGQWILCTEHSHLAFECVAKELISNMFAPPNPFNGKTIRITYNDKTEGQLGSKIIDATIKGFRISQTKYPGEPVIILSEGYNIYTLPLYDDIVAQLEESDINMQDLDEYSTSINKEYFKYAPQILLDRFPKYIIDNSKAEK